MGSRSIPIGSWRTSRPGYAILSFFRARNDRRTGSRRLRVYARRGLKLRFSVRWALARQGEDGQKCPSYKSAITARDEYMLISPARIPMNPNELTQLLKERARTLGFDLAGACPAVESSLWPHFRAWLDAGFAGEMQYLERHAQVRRHPHGVLPNVRSVLVLAMNYRTAEPIAPGPKQGSVSRYAWGADYHRVIRTRLRRLGELHRRLVPGERARGVVDTAPFPEREFARMAGLGWIGRNTMLINRRFGSWLFLAALLTTAELAHDEPTTTDHCKGCRACLEACPTGAIVAPYQIDACRCISYLTMEHSGPIPAEFHQPMGARIFGCDRCQEVCPHNKTTPRSEEPSFRPRNGMNPVDLTVMGNLDVAGFDLQFGDTPLARAGYARIVRNATLCRRFTDTTVPPRGANLPENPRE